MQEIIKLSQVTEPVRTLLMETTPVFGVFIMDTVYYDRACVLRYNNKKYTVPLGEGTEGLRYEFFSAFNWSCLVEDIKEYKNKPQE